MTTFPISSLPSQPSDKDGPVFRNVWEAQAFAISIFLYEHGLFDWKEWSAMLAEEISAAQATGDPDLGTTYYHHWMNTLERLIVKKGITTSDDLGDLARAWEKAAQATPHGQPITLTRIARATKTCRKFP